MWPASDASSVTTRENLATSEPCTAWATRSWRRRTLEMGAVRERLRAAWRGADGDSAAAGGLPLGTRPFDRLPSIRAKLGAVIVFAVAVTILIMYLAIG